MNTKKTLADAQPGGRVRLGDAPFVWSDRAKADALEAGQYAFTEADGKDLGYTACIEECVDAICSVLALPEHRAALSAQPSPGGQGDLAALAAKWRAEAAAHELNGLKADSIGLTVAAMRNDTRRHVLEAAAAELEAALAARQPVGEPVPLGYTDPIPCAWSDDDASSLITLRDALIRVIAGTTTKDAAHFLKQPGQRRMTIKDAQEIASAHLPYVESLMRRSQGFNVPRSHSLEREPVGFVLYEQQDKLVLFKGSWETDERWFWPEREQAQAAADRLHETHGFPNNYWLVTPVSAVPPAQAVDLAPRPMDTAPTDGTLVRLLVDFTSNATEDTAGPAWTIGSNNDGNVMADERVGWQFAGWCWTHDHFTEGEGTPVGWLPLVGEAAQAVDLGQFHALAALANAVVHHGDESPMKNGVFAEAERLLALIDSKGDSHAR